MKAAGRCDYLVVGGGAAGCIVARRLAEDPACRVMLLEAGRADEGDPLATDLSRLDEQDDSYDWGYRARPTRAASHEILYDRARMLGGCANHNDCAFLKPPPSDFARWVELGASGWDYAALEPAFARVEERLHIEASPAGTALSRAFIDACVAAGLPEIELRREQGPGAGWFPLNVRGALRQSSSVGYLHPLRDLPSNLELRCDTLATKLLVEQGRVSAVLTERGRIEVARETILCAGAINTPQLLLLSGIGPGRDLQRLGIAVHADAPGIGRNLLDHAAANVVCELRQPPPRWRLTPCEAAALLQVDAAAPAPDLLFHFVLTLRDKYAGIDYYGDAQHGIKLSPNVARPRSRGRLRLRSPDIHAAPDIDLNYFSDADGYDERLLIAGLRFALELLERAPLEPWIRRRIQPAPGIASDADLAAYIRATCETVYHPAGSCRLGAADDPRAPLTPDLRVKGVDALRVADASVFPSMVTVNICNTVMAVAERAAELIRRA